MTVEIAAPKIAWIFIVRHAFATKSINMKQVLSKVYLVLAFPAVTEKNCMYTIAAQFRATLGYSLDLYCEACINYQSCWVLAFQVVVTEKKRLCLLF